MLVILAVLCLVCIVAIVKPLPQIWLTNRKRATWAALVFFALANIVGSVSNEDHGPIASDKPQEQPQPKHTNPIDITPHLRKKDNPVGEGTFVKGYALWLFIDGQLYPLNPMSKSIKPDLPWPKDAPDSTWAKTNLNRYDPTIKIDPQKRESIRLAFDLPEPKKSEPKRKNKPAVRKSFALPVKSSTILGPHLKKVNTSKDVPVQGNDSGWLLGYGGHKCYYKQVSTYENSISYFYQDLRLKGGDTIMIFGDGECMTYTGTDDKALNDVAMAYAQKVINVAVSNWYSKPDADFTVNPKELIPYTKVKVSQGVRQGIGAGWCMKSRKYPMTGIAIDYFKEGKGLRAVIHNFGMGCE